MLYYNRIDDRLGVGVNEKSVGESISDGISSERTYDELHQLDVDDEVALYVYEYTLYVYEYTLCL